MLVLLLGVLQQKMCAARGILTGSRDRECAVEHSTDSPAIGGLRAESACRQKAEHDEEHQHEHLHDHERRLRSGRRQLVQEGQFGEGLNDADESVQIERGHRGDHIDPAPRT
jgi:hypothetical protein